MAARTVRKIFLIVLISLLALICLALLFTQTPIFRGIARGFIVDQVGALFDAELSVGQVRGNLFRNVELLDVLLIQDGDTVGFSERIALGYQPYRLLKSEIYIDSLIIDSLVAFIRQNPDSSWNILGLIKEDTASLADTAKAGPFGFSVRIEEFFLRNSSATVFPLNGSIRQFTDLVLHFSGSYRDTLQRVELEEFQVESTDPPFRLEHLGFTAVRSGNEVKLTDFIFKTSQNEIRGEGTGSSGQVSSQPLDLSEFSEILPGFYPQVKPVVSLSAKLSNDTLFAALELTEAHEAIHIELSAAPIGNVLDKETAQDVEYLVNARFDNVDVTRWTGRPSESHLLNGGLTIRGRGLNLDKADFVTELRLTNSHIYNHPFQILSADLSYRRELATGWVEAQGNYGQIHVQGRVREPLQGQHYDLAVQTNNLNLARLLNNDALRSNLTLAGQLNGSQLDPSVSSGSLLVSVAPSTFSGENIDSASAAFTYSPERYILDTLFIATPKGQLNAGGELTPAGDGQIVFAARLDDVSTLSAEVGADTLRGTVALIGRATGHIDSIHIAADLNGHNLLFDDIRADTLIHSLELVSYHDRILATGQGRTVRLSVGDTRLDSVTTEFEYTNDTLFAGIDAKASDTLTLRTKLDVSFASSATVTVHELSLRHHEQEWSKTGDAMRVYFDDNFFQFEDIELTRQNSDVSSRVMLDGHLDLEGEVQLTIALEAIDLASSVPLAGYQLPLEQGTLNAQLEVTGTARLPIMSGIIEIEDAKAGNFSIDSFHTTFDYKPPRFSWETGLAPNGGGLLSTHGYLPMRISFVDTGKLIIGDEPMELHASIEKVPLSIFELAGAQYETGKGWIEGELHYENTFDDPDLSGNLRIREGNIEFKRLGVDYDKFEVAVHFDNNTARLDSLKATRDDGYVKATGEMTFGGSLLSGKIQSTDFDIQFRDLYVSRHKNFELQLNGDANLHGSSTAPVFDGNLSIERSRLFVPLLTDEALDAKGFLDETPMLVAALEKDTVALDSAATQVETTSDSTVLTKVDYFRNLRGSILLRIPRNTWLKSPDMNLEIAGNLELVKNSPSHMELFGPIRIIRGDYSIYGRRFRIREGELNFVGGEEMNPNIDLRAYYVFRSPDREKRSLELHATGKAFAPNLAFSLDGGFVSTRDALAYVVFGRSMDEVAMSGGGGGGLQAEKIAEKVAAGMLARQLTQTLGKQFALDVVEISPIEGFQGATVTVGKYITTDLFMSYQRGVGENIDNNITPSNITLEYELNRLFSIQVMEGDPATSGADLLFKVDW